MGPIPDPFRDIEQIKEFFLAYHRTKLKVSENELLDFDHLFRTSRVFRFAPSVNVDYIVCLNKV